MKLGGLVARTASQRTYLVSPTFAITKLANGSDGLTPSDKWPGQVLVIARGTRVSPSY